MVVVVVVVGSVVVLAPAAVQAMAQAEAGGVRNLAAGAQPDRMAVALTALVATVFSILAGGPEAPRPPPSSKPHHPFRPAQRRRAPSRMVLSVVQSPQRGVRRLSLKPV